MSSDQAKSYHSITIGNKNTWDDWHLVPTSRPVVSPPPVKTHFVDVPGSDEMIDLTEALTGRPVYGNRTGSWEFFVINSGQLEPNSDYGEWFERYTTIMTYLHGLEYEAVLDDDPYYYYEGRYSVDSWSSQKGNSLITISYNVAPYKYSTSGANASWLWDTFYFGDPNDPNDKGDLIRTYKNLRVNGTLNVSYVTSADISSIPIIRASAKNMTVRFDGTTYNLKKGENVMNHIHFSEGTNNLKFTGNGTVTIEATGGIL